MTEENLETFIRAEISPGMFGNERAVRFVSGDGAEDSGFVHVSRVIEPLGLLAVRVLDVD